LPWRVFDGSGKGTQAQILAKQLDAIVISFPNYQTESGKHIKDYLQKLWRAGYSLNPKGPYDTQFGTLNAYLLQSLMTTNRLEAVDTINNYVSNGNTVILDRYYGSAIVYGQVDGLPKGWLETVHKTLPEPDLWLFIDTPVEDSFKRRPIRRDAYEADRVFLDKVHQKYVELFNEKRKDNKSWAIIDGTGTEEQVTKRIMEEISKL